ncbi:MAG: metallophosphoesterase family protein [Azospirillaceae bacterium]|nr:metallophosphoesterase family protein [Azospirillaceae bacterium]
MDILDRFRPHPRAPHAAPGPRVPDGLRVYAIGDIHGCLDLLDRLHARIESDAAGLPAGTDKLLIYLGDYVDRGPRSRQVVECLMAGPPPGFRAVYLRGNHEDYLIRFLTDLSVGSSWWRFGGLETLASYGVDLSMVTPVAEKLRRGQQSLKLLLPPAHRAFLTALPLSVVVGDYFFCHAGVRPGVALAAQDVDDLLWIRDDFLNCNDDLGKIVVHGHTVSHYPDVRGNRIGIDTGACFTGHLTCLVLERNTARFLQT